MVRRRKLMLLRGGRSFARTISPTYGDELFTDPGLEATYTDGLCATLTKSGTPIVSQSADSYSGAKAQAFQGAADNDSVYISHSDAIAARWFKISLFAKRLSGSAGNVKGRVTIVNTTSGDYDGSQASAPIVSPTYTEIKWTQYGDDLRYIFIQEYESAPFDSIVIGYISGKRITLSSMLKTKKTTATGDVIATVGISVPTRLQGGFVINLDSETNPQNYVSAYVDRNIDSADMAILFEKVVAGTKTKLLEVNTAYIDGAPLKVIKAGTTYQVFYNGVQVSTDQTISDAGIVDNTLHMQFASDPSVVFASYNV